MDAENTFFKMPNTLEVRLGIFLLLLCTLVLGPYLLTFKLAKPTVIEVVKPMMPDSDKEITHGDKTKKQVIFTFDGGDGVQSADQILAVLAKHHVKGTFFLTGKFMEANPDLVRRMATSGNEIFSHTYDHPHLTALTDSQIAGELVKAEDVLQTTAGISPKPYFRAPYGDRDGRVLTDAFNAGYESVYWSIDARDWEEPTGETADEVHQNIISNLAPGNIYLMHIGDTITGAILDQVFTEIENRGYRLVSLTQGL